jgi:hypothetical protein
MTHLNYFFNYPHKKISAAGAEMQLFSLISTIGISFFVTSNFSLLVILKRDS